MGGESIYYGLNALSNNLIMADRKKLKNPNGLILGTPGAGKSFAAKREITNAFIVTKDDIIVCDPEGEYYPLFRAFHGQVIEIEKERESEPGQAAPAAYGRYENVILTDTELSELQAELPDKWEYYIDRLSGYIASTGRKYKNHAATIRRWAADDTAKAAPKRGIPDYSYKEGESL